MNKEQIYTQQRIINKQNKRIKELEEKLNHYKKDAELYQTLYQSERKFRHECLETTCKLTSATLFQRIFQWKKL